MYRAIKFVSKKYTELSPKYSSKLRRPKDA